MKIIYCEVDDQPVIHLVVQHQDGRCVQYAFGEGDLRDYLRLYYLSHYENLKSEDEDDEGVSA